jgi:ribonuclease T2
MTMVRPLLRVLVPFVLLAPVSAWAQAYQCHAPADVGPIPPISPDGPARRVPIGGYTLAISWSPEYCKGNHDPNAMQCSGRNGRFGFVLHGLWPESNSGPPPQWCALTPMPAPADYRANLCMTPVPYLIAHEWLKHGSCMAKTPSAYFAQAQQVWRQVSLPDADHLSRKPGLTAGDLRDAFVEANPGWTREQIGLLVGNDGWLREVHVCLTGRFRPARCDPGRLGPANTAPLKIWRGL